MRCTRRPNLEGGLFVRVTFVVNGRTETTLAGGVVDPTFAGWNATTTASVGDKREPESALPGFNGDLRFLGVWGGVQLNVSQHNAVANLFAAQMGAPFFSPTTPLPSTATPSMWLDPANASRTNSEFEFPPRSGNVAEVVDGTVDIVRVLSLIHI